MVNYKKLKKMYKNKSINMDNYSIKTKIFSYIRVLGIEKLIIYKSSPQIYAGIYKSKRVILLILDILLTTQICINTLDVKTLKIYIKGINEKKPEKKIKVLMNIDEFVSKIL